MQNNKRGRPVEGKGRPLTRTFRMSISSDQKLSELAELLSNDGKKASRSDALDYAIDESLKAIKESDSDATN